MANQRKNNNKMNMNMSRPSMLWLYGLIGAFIIGYYVFGDVNDTPAPPVKNIPPPPTRRHGITPWADRR